MTGLDTNVLVRYFTHDDVRQTALAVQLVEHQLEPQAPGHVSVVTLAELVWVLRRRYDADKDTVVHIVDHLLGDSRFVVQHNAAIWVALDVYRQATVDFGDALVAALDRNAGCTRTLTFDRKAARIDGVQLLN